MSRPQDENRRFLTQTPVPHELEAQVWNLEVSSRQAIRLVPEFRWGYSDDVRKLPVGISYAYVKRFSGDGLPGTANGIVESYRSAEGGVVQKFYPEGTTELWIRRGTITNMSAWAKVGGGLNRVLIFNADVVFTAGSGSTLVATLETNVLSNYTYEIGIEPISTGNNGLSLFIYDWNWGSQTIVLDWNLLNNQKVLRLWKQANSTFSATYHIKVWRVVH